MGQQTGITYNLQPQVPVYKEKILLIIVQEWSNYDKKKEKKRKISINTIGLYLGRKFFFP